VNEQSGSFGWSLDGEWNMKYMKETTGKGLNFNKEDDKYNSGELANLFFGL